MYQSTTTSERLQKKNSEQTASTKSTLSQVASPAKMCHAPVLEKALKIAMARLLAADCGESTQGSLASLDQDGSWLKMSEGCCQQVLISDREETLELFSGTWPTWGIMRFGRVTELKPLAHHTKGKECSSWPTPRANDPEEKYSDVDLATNSVIRPNGTRFGASLGTVINTMQNKMWRTPDANLGTRGPKSAEMYEECKRTNKHALNLLDQVKHECNWPTPSTQEIEHDDFEITETGRRKSKDGNSSHSINLADTVKQWPTPNAVIYKNGAMSNEAWDKRISDNRQNDIAMAVYKVENQGALNSDWTEILMGLPIGWTDIDCEEPQPWPGWPAPMNAAQNWATPNTMDMLPPKRGEALARNKAKGGCRNLREDVDQVNEKGQYSYEPPRVIVGQKNRAKRLKCLGNGCVPQQVYPIFKAIMEIERVSR